MPIDENIAAHLIRIIVRIKFLRQLFSTELLLNIIIQGVSVPDTCISLGRKCQMSVQTTRGVQEHVEGTVTFFLPLLSADQRCCEADDGDVTVLQTGQQLHVFSSRQSGKMPEENEQRSIVVRINVSQGDRLIRSDVQ